MKVRVRSFAWLRERLGAAERELDVPAGTTPRALLKSLAGEGHPLLGSVAFAVNLEYVPADRPLADGDEVAFLPPVSGG